MNFDLSFARPQKHPVDCRVDGSHNDDDDDETSLDMLDGAFDRFVSLPSLLGELSAEDVQLFAVTQTSAIGPNQIPSGAAYCAPCPNLGKKDSCIFSDSINTMFNSISELFPGEQQARRTNPTASSATACPLSCPIPSKLKVGKNAEEELSNSWTPRSFPQFGSIEESSGTTKPEELLPVPVLAKSRSQRKVEQIHDAERPPSTPRKNVGTCNAIQTKNTVEKSPGLKRRKSRRTNPINRKGTDPGKEQQYHRASHTPRQQSRRSKSLYCNEKPEAVVYDMSDDFELKSPGKARGVQRTRSLGSSPCRPMRRQEAWVEIKLSDMGEFLTPKPRDYLPTDTSPCRRGRNPEASIHRVSDKFHSKHPSIGSSLQ